MNTIGIHNFNTNGIRVVSISGEPWFVAADVLVALGLDRKGGGSSNRYTQYLGTNEKQHVLWSTVRKTDVSFPHRGAVCISESGLYKLVLRANRTATAVAFQDWVTREVLPSIRKTGAYVTGQPSLQENPNSDPLELITAQASLLADMIAKMEDKRTALLDQANTITAALNTAYSTLNLAA